MIEYNPWEDEREDDQPRKVSVSEHYAPDELFGLEEHMRDSENTGDPRRCPIHPDVQTSTPDGMFDMVCGECEYMAEHGAELWDMDPANPHRTQCGYDTPYIGSAYPGYLYHGKCAKCSDVKDPRFIYDNDIPF